jgi:hypothetical protein
MGLRRAPLGGQREAARPLSPSSAESSTGDSNPKRTPAASFPDVTTSSSGSLKESLRRTRAVPASPRARLPAVRLLFLAYVAFVIRVPMGDEDLWHEWFRGGRDDA